MDSEMVISTPQGSIVDLRTVRMVSLMMKSDTGVSFSLYFKGLSADVSKLVFSYNYYEYSDSKDELYKKVQNIRAEIGRRINDGKDVKQVNGSVSLKKK